MKPEDIKIWNDKILERQAMEDLNRRVGPTVIGLVVWLVVVIGGGIVGLLAFHAPGWSVGLPIVVGIVGVFLFGPLLRNPRCPSCATRMKPTKFATHRNRDNTISTLVSGYGCKTCGFRFEFLAG